jgi:hypothetical protein
LKKPPEGSTALQKVAAVAWVCVLLVGLVAGIVLGPVLLFVLIEALAELSTTAIVRLIGIRGVQLVLGMPMIGFTAWGLLRVAQGKSAPDMTLRQRLAAVGTMVLLGAIGAGLVISAVAGDGRPRDPAAF